jgi:hypothetical protein
MSERMRLMVDITYCLQVIDNSFDDTHLKRNSEVTPIPSAKDKIYLEDMELIVKEVIYLTVLKKEFILIRLEPIFIKKSLDEFCKKYGFEKIQTNQWSEVSR